MMDPRLHRDIRNITARTHSRNSEQTGQDEHRELKEVANKDGEAHDLNAAPPCRDIFRELHAKSQVAEPVAATAHRVNIRASPSSSVSQDAKSSRESLLRKCSVTNGEVAANKEGRVHDRRRSRSRSVETKAQSVTTSNPSPRPQQKTKWMPNRSK